MVNRNTLMSLPVHSVLLAISARIVEIRMADRRQAPERPQDEIVGRLWDGFSQEMQHPKLRPEAGATTPGPSTKQTMQMAEDTINGINLPEDPDAAMTALGRLTADYLATVPKAVACASDTDDGPAYSLRTEAEVRRHLALCLETMFADVLMSF